LAVDLFDGDKEGVDRWLRDKIVRARVSGTCGECLGEIEPGTFTRSFAFVDDGAITSNRVCQDCCDAMAKRWKDDGKALDRRYELRTHANGCAHGRRPDCLTSATREGEVDAHIQEQAEAEAAGYEIAQAGYAFKRGAPLAERRAEIRGALEHQLAEALEEARAALDALDHPNGGSALNFWRRGRPVGEHIDAALKAFRGE